jgi:hypothetical protein
MIGCRFEEYLPDSRWDINCAVYAVSADRFNCITITCMIHTTKEKAEALCEKYNAINKSKKRKDGKRTRYTIIFSDEELARIKAKAEEINAVNIPRREKYWEAQREALKRQIKVDAYWHQKEQEYLKNAGWHYDNQQRVNEYKGTMRG